jgi:DNA repair protein RecO (recombination protein O)
VTPDSCLGVVLRTTAVRESDLVVVLYTDTHGRVSALARGAKRSQRRFSGALQLLVLGRFQLQRGRGELWTLDTAEIVREWTKLASDVVAVAHASYVVELVGALMPPEVPERDTLDLVCAAWDGLAEGPSSAGLRFVELALLELAGHQPALDRCVVCGNADLETGAVFDATRGGALCRTCAAASRGFGVKPLSAATRAYLMAIAAADSPGAARAVDARFEPEDRRHAREAIVAMVTGLVGKPLRSLEYLAKLAAAGPRHS